MRLVFTFAMSLLLQNAIYAQTDAPDMNQLDEKIRALVTPYVEANVLRSVAIGVIDGDKELVIGIGEISDTNKSSPDKDTVFEIGSISKVFTGILLADAIERKVVTSDLDVAQLLPESIKMPTWPRDPSVKVTLTHLSTHVSGLPRMPDNLNPADDENPYADYSEQQMFEFLDQCKLQSKPGRTDTYSNLGTGLLGHLIATKQESDYGSLLADRITGPLSMSDTSLTFSDSQRKRLAPGHDMSLDQVPNWDFTTFAGAGGIRSTIGDMLKFARANLSPPDNATGKAIELAWKEQRPAVQWGGESMGFGWMIRKNKIHWHNGGTGGYHSMLQIDRKNNRAVVVLCNTSAGEIDTLSNQIMALVSGKKLKLQRKPKKRTIRKTVEVSDELRAKYIGKYQLTASIFITVATARLNAKQLTVQLTGQDPLRIYPASETKWFLKAVEAEIEFNLNDNGQCESLTLVQNGRQEAKRVE